MLNEYMCEHECVRVHMKIAPTHVRSSGNSDMHKRTFQTGWLGDKTKIRRKSKFAPRNPVLIIMI